MHDLSRKVYRSGGASLVRVLSTTVHAYSYRRGLGGQNGRADSGNGEDILTLAAVAGTRVFRPRPAPLRASFFCCTAVLNFQCFDALKKKSAFSKKDTYHVRYSSCRQWEEMARARFLILKFEINPTSASCAGVTTGTGTDSPVGRFLILKFDETILIRALADLFGCALRRGELKNYH